MRVPRWIRIISKQKVLVALLILAQFALIGYSIFSHSLVSDIVRSAATLTSFCVGLHVFVSKNKPAYKISLLVLITAFPLFGGVFYLLYKGNVIWYSLYKRSKEVNADSLAMFKLFDSAAEEAKKEMPEFAAQINYLDGNLGLPIYKNTETRYFSSGEETFAALCEELKNAEKYIFLEFFIVREGKMWSAIEEILKERVLAGVDVRVIYDDMGSMRGLSDRKIRELENLGVKISVFNMFVPFISSSQNHRDHRKIAVIDGKTAFTGGVNIADEYINELERFGHWKDTAVKLSGDGAWSFTLMFLRMWSLCQKSEEDYASYYPPNMPRRDVEGYVLPYSDSPIDTEYIGENVYMQMINGAREYLYITTPYLIVDDDMMSALTLAAKSGVDVRVITPYRYDKFLVHFTTRSYYKQLIDAGIKVYEYTPGFMHSKTFVSDDRRAVVGTVNMDFRSLYLHFECGAVFYDTPVVADVKKDFLDTLKQCHRITEEDCRRGALVRFCRSIIRLFAPMM